MEGKIRDISMRDTSGVESTLSQTRNGNREYPVIKEIMMLRIKLELSKREYGLMKPNMS